MDICCPLAACVAGFVVNVVVMVLRGIRDSTSPALSKKIIPAGMPDATNFQEMT
jgi:hypothetical protein